MKLYQVEAWATNGTARPVKAVKIFALLEEEPNATVLQDYKAQAVALYRRTYQEWSTDGGKSCTEREFPG